MAITKDQRNQTDKKRKFNSASKPETDKSKKPKFVSSKISNPKKPYEKQRDDKNQTSKQSFKPKFDKPKSGEHNQVPESKRDARIRAKELAEARKKRRKQHYTLEQELALLWEKVRRRDIAKEERSKLITEAIKKMKGKIAEIAGSHVSSRVLQSCVKYCSQSERDTVFVELQPHLLNLACNTYSVHLLKKMLDNASKKQLASCISILRGHVASLLRHMVGSVVVEHAYHLGNANQKQELMMELYSTELQLFKDLVSTKEKKLVDIMAKLSLQKGSVQRHMISVIQPVLEKGIVDHSIIHRVLMEYLTIADKSSAADILQQLSGPLLVRMIHTRDGSRLGVLCIKHGSAKERKKVIKGLKDHVGKVAHDQCGSLVLACILSTVDDTKLITKMVVRELQKVLKELMLDKNGRRPLLQLLHPNCSRYFSPDDLASLDLSLPCLSAKNEPEETPTTEDMDEDSNDKEKETVPEETVTEPDQTSSPGESVLPVEGGKKDPFLRRQELLVKSGLAESLIKECIESADELLRSNFGREVIYEVATGGSDGILQPTLNDQLRTLYKTIASLAAETKSKKEGDKEEEKEDHVLENFHSSRTIRKLILDCPDFASVLWKEALEGKCESWAEGHGSKVLSAFLETPDSEVRDMAKGELQPLIDGGKLKVPKKPEASK